MVTPTMTEMCVYIYTYAHTHTQCTQEATVNQRIIPNLRIHVKRQNKQNNDKQLDRPSPALPRPGLETSCQHGLRAANKAFKCLGLWFRVFSQ